MKAHTPGPWLVVDGHYPSFKEVTGASFKISCVMWATDLTDDDYEKRDADLHVIAAAPDLLAALKSLVELDKTGGEYSAWNDRFMQARAAIKKAEGV